MFGQSGSGARNSSLADPEKQSQKGSYVGTYKNREGIEAYFLQVLGPNQQRLSTEGGDYSNIGRKIHLRPNRTIKLIAYTSI